MSALDDLFGLSGKTALVTGASSGLGVEMAQALAGAGAQVAIMARRRERLEGVAAEIRKAGGTCLPVTGDVTSEDDLDAVVGEVEKAFGGVDILVNNAGVADVGRAEKVKRETWERTLATNLTAPFLLSQKVARGMIERGRGGRIINIASVVAEVGDSVLPTVAYCASKGGLANLTRQLAVEWARHGITANAIAPSWIPTEINMDPRVGGIKPELREKMESLTPMGRLGTPADIRGAVVFLASPAAAYVTGIILPVDGGWLAW